MGQGLGRMAVDDFFSFDTEKVFNDAPVCEELVEVEKEIKEGLYEEFDEINYRNNLDWSILSSQVFGAEYM